MDKNHSQNFSEEKLDRFAQAIARSIILTDEEVDEIADSPRLWWRVQSSIHEEKARRAKKSRFFFVRWQFAASGVFAVLILAIAALWFFSPPKTEIADVKNEKQIAAFNQTTAELLPDIKLVETPIQKPTAIEKEKPTDKIERKTPQTGFKLKPASLPSGDARKSTQIKKSASQKSEIATDFIRLSYLPATESGQVVRVKVPRSMLVSLGVTTNVEKPSELVNAEVIVGDDGATRAIRFLAN